jgi:uncharacterized membrane protein
MILAMYIPNWERAIGAGFLQLILIGVLWVACFAFARSRWNTRLSAVVLGCGVIIPVAVTHGISISRSLGNLGDSWRGFLDSNYSDTFLIIVKFFELYDFAVVCFLGIVISLIVLFLIGTIAKAISTDQAVGTGPLDS